MTLKSGIDIPDSQNFSMRLTDSVSRLRVWGLVCEGWVSRCAESEFN